MPYLLILKKRQNLNLSSAANYEKRKRKEFKILEHLAYISLSGVRILDGPMTDSMEASAFTKHFQINDVFSCR